MVGYVLFVRIVLDYQYNLIGTRWSSLRGNC